MKTKDGKTEPKNVYESRGTRDDEFLKRPARSGERFSMTDAQVKQALEERQAKVRA